MNIISFFGQKELMVPAVIINTDSQHISLNV